MGLQSPDPRFESGRRLQNRCDFNRLRGCFCTADSVRTVLGREDAGQIAAGGKVWRASRRSRAIARAPRCSEEAVAAFAVAPAALAPAIARGARSDRAAVRAAAFDAWLRLSRDAADLREPFFAKQWRPTEIALVQ